MIPTKIILHTEIDVKDMTLLEVERLIHEMANHPSKLIEVITNEEIKISIGGYEEVQQ